MFVRVNRRITRHDDKERAAVQHHPLFVVIAGLDPAIHSATAATGGTLMEMDARVEPGHDDKERVSVQRRPDSPGPNSPLPGERLRVHSLKRMR
jgi:hypothetical protein